jgi:uncharacterized 2Fe-2S/4Fe-4S cluster protein (DUF4445 family)
MPEVLIRLEPLGENIHVAGGTPLREILFAYGVEFPCGGEARCKRCRVRVIEGHLDEAPSTGILTPRELAEGWRLSCRAVAQENATLEVGQWESSILSDESEIELDHGSCRTGVGVAIDLGTTTLVAQLVDLQTAAVLGVRTALNPQARHGADVMTRVQFALDPSGRDELCRLIRDELGRMVRELACGHRAPAVIHIVGNTVMHHLFCAIDVTPLAHAPFESPAMDAVEFTAQELNWPEAAGATIRFLPNLGGFVGSDILAGILATHIEHSEDLVALVDLGTNGEIVIGNRDGLICASTAVGPAFEGGRISCGMRAATGAISRVELEDGHLRCRVLGGGEARGICGSGLVDAVACGLEMGAVQPNGRIRQPIRLADDLQLTQQDIRQVQLAKGAIAGGLRILLRRAGAQADDVTALYLAGAFGNYIKVASARRIGLLEFPDDIIQPAGNTALLGARRTLFADDNYSGLRAKIEHVPLAADPDFQDEYVSAMAFPAGDNVRELLSPDTA